MPASAFSEQGVSLLVSFSAEQLEELAGRVADVLRHQTALVQADSTPWVRGAGAAAAYLGCPRSRIYELVARRELEYAKDGSRLLFRREWLDRVGEG